MAKKKVAAHSHHQQQKDSRDTTTHHPQNHEVNVKPDGPVTVSEPMEKKQDPSEKLQSLKSLNSLLLKETFERRQQVESLEQAKSAMEADLARVGTDKRGLETELLVAIQQNVSLELEKSVVCVFLETRLNEVFADFGTLKGHLEVEILGFREKVGELSASLENERAILSQVTRERDSLKSDCGSWMAKANEMRENLNEMDKMRRDLEKRFENLTAEHLKLLEENSEGNRALEVAIQVGDSVRSDLQAAAAEIDALNRKIDELYRENKGMELEKSEREVKIKELEKQIVMLEEDVRSLRKEEKKMQDMVLELGKRLEEASEKEKEMARQIEALVEAGKEKEASIEMVKGEKESLENLLKMARLELEEKEQMMEGIIREKNEIEEANYSSQNEITELQKDMDELRNEVTALQMSFGDETEKNRALVCEINEHKEALDRVLLEKDSVEKLFVEESHKVVSLRSKVGELETKMEEATVALVKLMSDKDELKVQKEESLKRLENLRKEKELLDEKLLDAEQSINKYKSEIEIASVKSCRALSFVRETVSSMVTDSEEKISERGCFVFEEEDVFVKELDRMKKCFQVKESMVDDLLRQIDTMQYSVDKEKKSKHLWSLVSSATTFVAAVLVAYFARK